MKFLSMPLLLLLLLSLSAHAEDALSPETPGPESETAPTIYATPTLIFIPNPDEVWAEISLHGIQQNETSESSAGNLIDFKKNAMEFNTHLASSFGSIFYGGLNLLYTSSGSSTDTTASGVSTITHSNTDTVSDPSFSFGARFNNPGVSAAANLSFSIPGIQTNSYGTSSTTTSKNTGLAWTPSFVVFGNDANKSLPNLTLSYEFSPGQHQRKVTKAGVATVTDIQGGNRTTITPGWEWPLKDNALGLTASYIFVEPTRLMSGLTETDDAQYSEVEAEIYYKINLDENFFIYPSFIYERLLTDTQNGTQIFHDDTYQVAITGRCIF